MTMLVKASQVTSVGGFLKETFHSESSKKLRMIFITRCVIDVSRMSITRCELLVRFSVFKNLWESEIRSRETTIKYTKTI